MFDTYTHTDIECVLIISIVDRRQTFNAARCPLALYTRTHSAQCTHTHGLQRMRTSAAQYALNFKFGIIWCGFAESLDIWSV